MLTIQKNSRQVPKVEIYTTSKQYYDLIYSYLQEISYLEDGNRYVNKKECSSTCIGERLQMTRQTASKYFKGLIELDLIEYQEVGRIKRYKLKPLDKSVACLVPFETLRILNNALNHNAISIYVYLINRYIANGEKEFVVTNNQLLAFIGYAFSPNNNIIVGDILNVLQKLELIFIRYEQTKENKTLRYITYVTNMIKKC